MFVHSFRERLSNLNRVAIAGAIFLISPFFWLASGGVVALPGSKNAVLLSLVFGAGIIGADVSSGVLQVVLVRPVTRTVYIVAKWLSASVIVAALSVAQTAIALLVNLKYGQSPDIPGALMLVSSQIVTAAALVAVLTGMSAVTPGYGNMRVWILLYILGGVTSELGNFRKWPVIKRVGEETGNLIMPTMDFGNCVGMSPFPWFQVVSVFSTAAIFIVLAIYAMNRREISYGGN